MLPTRVEYRFHEDLDPVFFRTRFLNKMIDTVTTKYVSVWDVDVIIRREQILKTTQLLDEGLDVVYPYDQFLDTTDEIRRIYLSTGGDISILQDSVKYMHELYGTSPVGGSFFIRTDKYIASGKENEDYYGWGYEDGDRYYRWANLGYKMDRVHGPLFHLWHPRGLNSSTPNADSAVHKKRFLLSTIKDNNNE
ncbi:MAG: galactosyltransferase-related protein [Paraprevotella sp.]|nr:galactosyltransferase-related protein [Paraprevotella sp.]